MAKSIFSVEVVATWQTDAELDCRVVIAPGGGKTHEQQSQCSELVAVVGTVRFGSVCIVAYRVELTICRPWVDSLICFHAAVSRSAAFPCSVAA